MQGLAASESSVTFRAPTPEDFISPWDDEVTYHFFEDENGGSYFAHGSLSDEDFLEELSDFLRRTEVEDFPSEEPQAYQLKRYDAYIKVEPVSLAHGQEEVELVVPAAELSKEEKSVVNGLAPVEIVVLSW